MGSEQLPIIVITGCTNGLGFHAVSTLYANTKATVILACRNAALAEQAAASIKAPPSSLTSFIPCANREATLESKGDLVVLPEPLDLADLASVRKYVSALKEWLGNRKITSLVNNAGIGGSPQFKQSEQGYEAIFATNHLGHFLLTLLCLPLLAEGARIVNVSSEVHDPATKTHLPDPGVHWPSTQQLYDEVLAGGKAVADEDDRTSGSRRYSRSKLCNVLFTYELARHFTQATPFGVEVEALEAYKKLPASTCTLPLSKTWTVIAMNPGLMLDTNFFSAAMGQFPGVVAYVLSPILRLTSLGNLMRSGPQSGGDLASLATDTLKPEGQTAAYYDGQELHASSEFSRSKESLTKYQQELWQHSLRWAGVTSSELSAAGFK